MVIKDKVFAPIFGNNFFWDSYVIKNFKLFIPIFNFYIKQKIFDV
jgi:hypothetical protein